MPFASWYDRLRRHPAAQAIDRTVVQRLVAAGDGTRRAWRRSLQFRMVSITLVVSVVLVGAFGVLVASQITAGLVDAKVKAGVRQVQESAARAAPQLGGVTDAADTSLPGLVRLVGQNLAPPTSSPDTQVYFALLPATQRIPGSARSVVPPVDKVRDVIPAGLQQRIADGKVAHQFIEADVDGVALGGQHDDRDPRLRPDRPADVDPAHAGQHQVEQHDVRPGVPERAEGALPVGDERR